VQNSLSATDSSLRATDEQKQKFLLPFARGERSVAYATHRAASRFECRSPANQAVKKDDRYVLNGTKAWITTAAQPMRHRLRETRACQKAKKALPQGRRKRPRQLKGWQGRKKTWHQRHRLLRTGLQRLRSAVSNRIGTEVKGISSSFNARWRRIGIAAQATGIAQGASRLR